MTNICLKKRCLDTGKLIWATKIQYIHIGKTKSLQQHLLKATFTDPS